MPKLVIVSIALISVACFQQEETFTSMSKTAHVYSTDQGLCPFAVLSDRNGPVALFGVYKSKNDNPKFGYLVLFQPQGDRKEACKVTTTLKKGTTSETGTDAVSELKWDDNKIEVAWKLTTDDRSGRIDKNDLKINGKTFDSNSRLLLAKRVGDKLEFTPIKDVLPSKVPNAANADGWAKEVQAAISELKSSSQDVAKFLKKS